MYAWTRMKPFFSNKYMLIDVLKGRITSVSCQSIDRFLGLYTYHIYMVERGLANLGIRINLWLVIPQFQAEYAFKLRIARNSDIKPI